MSRLLNHLKSNYTQNARNHFSVHSFVWISHVVDIPIYIYPHTVTLILCCLLLSLFNSSISPLVLSYFHRLFDITALHGFLVLKTQKKKMFTIR